MSHDLYEETKSEGWSTYELLKSTKIVFGCNESIKVGRQFREIAQAIQ